LEHTRWQRKLHLKFVRELWFRRKKKGAVAVVATASAAENI